MTTSNKLNEFNHTEDPARRLLERLGWTYVPGERLAPERPNERDVLLKDRLRAALLRLNDGLTGAQAERSSSTWNAPTASAWRAIAWSTST